MFQLAPLSWIPKLEKEMAVRVTADRGRKSWTELRAGVRYFNLTFVLTINGREVAFLRRHPSYALKQLPGWLEESERRSSSMASEVRSRKVNAGLATVSNGKLARQKVSPFRLVEERFVGLESAVQRLQSTTEDILRLVRNSGLELPNG